MKSAQEQLAELEDSFILGGILESDYQERKRTLIMELRDSGKTVQRGNIQIAEGKDTLGVPYCYVPAGPFFFGDEDTWKDLKCSFYIAKYPITVGQYMEFLREGNIEYSDEDLETLQLVSPEADCPASHLSYLDAKEYCRWLRRVTNEYYSLPHEVEWEKSARGEDGRFYPWGNEPPTEGHACYQGDRQFACTVPVQTFEEKNVSPYGCVDMVGNTWEWCLDTFDDERDPHILRGGSWCNEIDYSNCLARTFSYPPDKRVDYGGFRVVYLPHDMLVEYRRNYQDFGNATKAGLRVVSISKSAAGPKAASPSTGLSALSKALDKAAAAAAGETVSEDDVKADDAAVKTQATKPPSLAAPAAPAGDDDMQDVLAKAISSAAAQFLRKGDDATSALKLPETSKEEAKPKLGFGADNAPKYKSITALRAEKQEKAGEKAPAQTLEFEEQGIMDAAKATAAKIPNGLTVGALLLWFVLLIAIVGLSVYRLTTF